MMWNLGKIKENISVCSMLREGESWLKQFLGKRHTKSVSLNHKGRIKMWASDHSSSGLELHLPWTILSLSKQIPAHWFNFPISPWGAGFWQTPAEKIQTVEVYAPDVLENVTYI